LTHLGQRLANAICLELESVGFDLPLNLRMTYLYSSAHNVKSDGDTILLQSEVKEVSGGLQVNRIVTVALVNVTTQKVRKRNPKA
jgi:putative heme iron utilization protein